MLGDRNDDQIIKRIKIGSSFGILGSLIITGFVYQENGSQTPFFISFLAFIINFIIITATNVISYFSLEGYEHGFFMQGYGSNFIRSLKNVGITIIIGGGVSLLISVVFMSV